jgi:hypothetical protein
MVTDQQVRRLFKIMNKEKTFVSAAAKAGMDEKTARKYRKLGKLPSEVKIERSWKTRQGPFDDIWDEVSQELAINPGLEAKTLFKEMQKRYSGRFEDGQLRTFQRRIKSWRATAGPSREVFFAQKHEPGNLCQSDFTGMNSLGITICRQHFPHLIYHFVLTYSNWETGTICFSESFESLSEGLQNALWKLGGAPSEHRTDRLTAAVNNLSKERDFTAAYNGLLNHYGIIGCKTQANSPHENGDVEQRHYRFKKAVDQALMLRGSRDFNSREEYIIFIDEIFDQLNAGRRKRLAQESELLRRLPQGRLDACKRLREIRVGRGSTINVLSNVYSVESRLIGEKVEVRVYAEYLEVWYAQRRVDRIPRLRGKGKHKINYRHLIDSLLRKPGAFENYRYREDIFPTSRFRIAYDELKRRWAASRAAREYLKILHLAAGESEERTDRALRVLIDNGSEIMFERIEKMVRSRSGPEKIGDVEIAALSLSSYDDLLDGGLEG